MKYSNDGVVCFNEANHTYINTQTGKQLESVTTYINKFKNKFDSEYWAKKESIKTGETKQQVLDRWSAKAKASCDRGTLLHKMFEDYTDGKSIEKYTDDIHLVGKGFIADFYESKRLTPIQNEVIVYGESHAGQVDNISKDALDNHYILDFKSNDTITDFSYGKTMLGEYSNYNDANFIHYSLQLSIYKKLFKSAISGLFIIHITDKEYNVIKCIDMPVFI